jgi:hypothetical protein
MSIDADDVYFTLKRGKGFHNLVYMSYVKHINQDSKAYITNTTFESIPIVTTDVDPEDEV